MVHPSHAREFKVAVLWVGILLLAALLILAIAPGATTVVVANYIPIHTTLETFAISVALMIFVITWGIHKFRPSGRLILVGLSFLAVALLDISHTLSYPGMPDFLTPSHPEKAINFWLAARSAALAGLLIVAFFPDKLDKWFGSSSRYFALLGVLALILLVHFWFLGYPDSVPSTFDRETGLTDFKVAYEYTLMGGYLIAAWGFLLQVRHRRLYSASGLFAAAMIMAMSEFLFTRYSDVSDLYNLAGHAYKIIAYGFLYFALFLESVQRPYHDLARSQARLKATLDALPDVLFEVDKGGNFLSVYVDDPNRLAVQDEEIEGRNLRELLPLDAAILSMDALHEAAEKGRSTGTRIQLMMPDGLRYFELSISEKRDTEEGTLSYLVLSRDVTNLVLQEQSLAHEAKLNRNLLALQSKVDTLAESDFLGSAVEAARVLTDSQFAILWCTEGSADHVSPEDWPAGLTRYQTVAQGSLPESILSHEFWSHAIRGHLPEVYTQHNPAGSGAESLLSGPRLLRAISIPVMEGDKVRMLVGVANKVGKYSAQDTEALQILANQVWTLLKRSRQEETIYRLSKALDQNPYPVMMTDAQARIEYVNPAFTQVSGYSAEEVLGQESGFLRSGKTPLNTYRELWSTLLAGHPWRGEFVNRRKDGDIYVERALIFPVMDSSGKVFSYVAHKEDITEYRAAQDRIRQLSDYDQLTGLLNRSIFDTRVEALIEGAEKSAGNVYLFWLDLDNFKVINDTVGHTAGDEILIETANRLRSVLGPEIPLCRHSGDAFVAAIANIPHARAVMVAQQILDEMQGQVTVASTAVAVTASIGIASYPEDGKDSAELVKCAEVAMYRMKQEGRNGVRFYSPDMQENTRRTLMLLAALKQAMVDESLRIEYQPQRSLAQPDLVGAEALLRWNHPEFGMISPAEFVPLAEQSGLVVQLGNWVLEHVAQQIAQWNARGFCVPVIAVNFSGFQFYQPDLTAQVSELMARYGVSPENIEIELTEAVALRNPQLVVQTIDELSAEGFKVAIDDFGTGYSSMSYLKRFALDRLKIDQSFVRDLGSDPDDQAIVIATIQMAHGLGLTVIAEGVETDDQAEFLKGHGCDQIQGYWYQRPMVASQFENLMPRRLNSDLGEPERHH